jgi:hypothetical protein
MSFSGRKFSINRHTGEPKPLARRFSTTEPSMNGTFLSVCLSVCLSVSGFWWLLRAYFRAFRYSNASLASRNYSEALATPHPSA